MSLPQKKQVVQNIHASVRPLTTVHCQESERSADDIDALKYQIHLLQKELASETEKRQQFQKSQNQLVELIAAEMKSPLNTIHESLGSVIQGQVDVASYHAAALIDTADRNCAYVLELVDQLEAVRKLDNGTMALERQDSDMLELIDVAVQSIRGYGQDSGQCFIFDKPETRLSAHVDPRYFLEIMGYLLANALYASPGEGVIRVVLRQYGDHIRISVIDQGISVPKGSDPFSLLGTHGRGSATGLSSGLYYCKALTEAFGGEIGYVTVPYGGTEFYVDLPQI